MNRVQQLIDLGFQYFLLGMWNAKDVIKNVVYRHTDPSYRYEK